MTNQLLTDLARVRAQFQMEAIANAIGLQLRLNKELGLDVYSKPLDNQHKNGLE